MLSRKTFQTLTFAAAAALLAFPAPPTRADDTNDKIKTETAPARNWVKEAQMTLKVRTKVLTRIKTSDALRIHIESERQTVTLTGEMEKESNIALAGSLAKSVEGVQHVTNNITFAPDKNRTAAAESAAKTTGHEIKDASKEAGAKVESAADKTGHEIKDALLETKIKSKLLAQTGVHAMKIEVEAEAGAITLTGSTDDGAIHDRALRIVRATDGVKTVNDQLTIKAGK